MFCPEGRTPLDEVIASVVAQIEVGYPDERLKQIFTSHDWNEKYVGNRLRLWLSRCVFGDLISDCQSLAVTSPTGLTLRVSARVLVSFENYPPLIDALGLRKGDENYIFVQPESYVLSTVFWDNQGKKALQRHLHPDDFTELFLLAQNIENFEGWALSIRDSDVPKSQEILEPLIRGWLPETTSEQRRPGRPSKVQQIVAQLGAMYPTGTPRPSSKQVVRDLEVRGFLVSAQTVMRAWQALDERDFGPVK